MAVETNAALVGDIGGGVSGDPATGVHLGSVLGNLLGGDDAGTTNLSSGDGINVDLLGSGDGSSLNLSDLGGVGSDMLAGILSPTQTGVPDGAEPAGGNVSSDEPNPGTVVDGHSYGPDVLVPEAHDASEPHPFPLPFLGL